MEIHNGATLNEIMPHISICEWGDADTESILRNIMIATENKLSAISVQMSALPVTDALSNAGIKIFAFINNIAKLPALAERRNVSAQLFTTPKQLDDLQIEKDMRVILAFQLKDIEHLDWDKIVQKKSETGGFMFIDDNKTSQLHKLYDFLNQIGNDFAGEIHYCGKTNNVRELESVYRLVRKMRPDMLPNLRLFVSQNFFTHLDNAGKSI